MPSLKSGSWGGPRPNAGRPPKSGYTAKQLTERGERRAAWQATRSSPDVAAVLDLRAKAKALVRAATDLERAYRAAEAVLDKAIDAGNARFPDAEARRT